MNTQGRYILLLVDVESYDAVMCTVCELSSSILCVPNHQLLLPAMIDSCLIVLLQDFIALI